MTTSPQSPPPSTSDPRDEQARAWCLRLLTARSRTRAELSAGLTKKGYSADVTARVLERLATVGLVDDVDFAEQWVHSRRVSAGKGKLALAAELRDKGVSGEVISAALADVDAEAERASAEELVRTRLRRERFTSDQQTSVMRRLVAMLARRGYEQSMAYAVVSAEVAGELQRRHGPA